MITRSILKKSALLLPLILLISPLILLQCGSNGTCQTCIITDEPCSFQLDEQLAYQKQTPSFAAHFDMAIIQEADEQIPNLKGDIVVDQPADRLKLVLKDATLGMELLYCVQNQDVITLLILYPDEDPVVVKGLLETLQLSRYFSDIQLDLSQLLELVRGSVPIQEDCVVEKKGYGYLLTNDTGLKQFVMLEPGLCYIHHLVQYRDETPEFRVTYEKYASVGSETQCSCFAYKRQFEQLDVIAGEVVVIRKIITRITEIYPIYKSVDPAYFEIPIPESARVIDETRIQ
jgi:hypothetical protein